MKDKSLTSFPLGPVPLLLAIVAAALLFPAGAAYADRGPIVWNEGVELRQDSQKAIILHNSTEEVLILGTELKANKETEILEFIPFPSEPKVSLAKGNPFEGIAKLIQKKGLLFRMEDLFFTKGDGAGGTTTQPVEIRLSEKIGLHDVTTIKINDIEQFSQWLGKFFESKGIRPDKERFQDVYRNARDYLQRGYGYFVFDRVKVSEKVKFLEPLTYRFKTDKIYYPLKTSNLIGGTGTVEMILVLPGSISDDLWQTVRKVFVTGDGREMLLSSSARVYPEEVTAIYGPEPFFGKAKIYLQVFRYRGGYDFRDDFTYGVNRLVPYAYRQVEHSPIPEMTRFVPSLTGDEMRDLREAFCPESGPNDGSYVDRSELSCGNFIPNDEYEVYAALFRKRQLNGIPWGDVVLEANTVRKQYKGKNIDKSIDEAIVKNFNDNNRTPYPLERAFPRDGKPRIAIRGDKDADLTFTKGKTYVSRAGFNKDRTKALVCVEHIAGPRSGIGYFVTVEKEKGEWAIAGFHPGTIY